MQARSMFSGVSGIGSGMTSALDRPRGRRGTVGLSYWTALCGPDFNFIGSP